MKAGDFITDVMHSVAFLSRLPVPSRFFGEGDGASMRRTARAFPAAGLLIALPAAFLVVIFATFDASPQLTGWLAIGLTALITGALHEDGLADMADGFGSGKDKARMLEIMKDSRIGSYGTIAMVLSFALRATALASLIETLPGKTAAACLIATLVMSRALMVALAGPARCQDIRHRRRRGPARRKRPQHRTGDGFTGLHPLHAARFAHPVDCTCDGGSHFGDGAVRPALRQEDRRPHRRYHRRLPADHGDRYSRRTCSCGMTA